jgi:two-component system, chemotaxis family, response regulator WspF
MRIGIVNDLMIAREALRRIVLATPGHEVAWMAVDGADAVACAQRDRPDLILMDLIMPGVDGVDATRRIMAETPCAILVVTASVTGHMNKVYEAMGLGALDAVDTPILAGGPEGASSLLRKIDTIGKLVVKSSPAPRPTTPVRRADVPRGEHHPVILLGSSTGGPSALAEILSAFPKRWNATTIIAQHVDVAFAPGLASWLSDRSGRLVRVITEGMTLGPGCILLAGTNDHAVLQANGRLHYTPDPIEMSYRPSVDVLFQSFGRHCSEPGVAALLTGMGRDGALGLLELRNHGWHTIAQDEATSVVPGMPKAAAKLGAAELILPLSKIGVAIVAHVQSILSTMN